MDDIARRQNLDRLDSLATVLDLIRTGRVHSKPEIARETGFGRTVVSMRVSELMDSGLIVEDGLAQSSGGRAPRRLSFSESRALLLVAELGATSISVGVATLTGEIIASRREPSAIADGPDVVLTRVETLFDDLVAANPGEYGEIWGIGIGVPGPVEYRSGRPVSPPIMPGWDAYPIRERLESRYGAPVWVDNDVNLMALGEHRAGIADGADNLVFVKIGSGIGAGLISNGRLQRGDQGVAGDVGHIEIEADSSVLCRCGNYGCAEAIAGGSALLQRAREHLAGGGSISGYDGTAASVTLDDLASASQRGDRFARDLFDGSARSVGRLLATLVNIQNPSLVVLGGAVAGSSDSYLAIVKEVVFGRSTALATRDLTIAMSRPSADIALRGAAQMIIEQLFSRDELGHWIDSHSPRALIATAV
jgi:predicted NBD/HSP70 family sugar kinase